MPHLLRQGDRAIDVEHWRELPVGIVHEIVPHGACRSTIGIAFLIEEVVEHPLRVGDGEVDIVEFNQKHRDMPRAEIEFVP